MIDLRKTKKTLVDICMDETGGLGVDCVLDNGGKNSLLSSSLLRSPLFPFPWDMESDARKQLPLSIPVILQSGISNN